MERIANVDFIFRMVKLILLFKCPDHSFSQESCRMLIVWRP